MKPQLAALISLLWFGLPEVAAAQGEFTVGVLRCEYLKNPLGIDVEQPRLSWLIAAGPRGQRQTAYQVLVASTPENLQRDQGDLWDSGKVESNQSVFVAYAGRPLVSGARCYWKVRAWDNHGQPSPWSLPGFWSMGVLRESEWSARFIGMARPVEVKEGTPLPFPWLRKTIDLAEKPARAMAFINPLGYYELFINGRKVDDHVLSPAVSDYSKRNLYLTHDVTGYLVPGKNCFVLWLGRGWYVRGHPGVIHDGPLVRAQFDLERSDGTKERIITDASWKVRESPLAPLGRGTAFGDYGGERYEAGRELPGWNTAVLDDSDWRAAAVFDPPAVTTAAQMVQPNRIVKTIRPVKVEELSPGVYLVNLGTNLTGWFELRIPAGGAESSGVKLEYADFKRPSGRLDTYNQRDLVIPPAGRDLTFCSRFNYHAFSLVRITGLKRAPSREDIKGYLIHTGFEPASEFACSSDLLNQIYQATTWTYRCLTMGGYVVDCPHRERLGYGGDAGTSLETGMFSFTTGALYSKWTADWRAAQQPETGDLPYTAPNYQDQGGGGPMWSGFVVTLPWQLYLQYGDKRILEVSYPHIQKWLAFVESKTAQHVLQFYKSYGMRMAEWNFLGDWVSPRQPGQERDPSRGQKTAPLINNCHYLYTLELAARIASVLAKPDDATMYAKKAESLRESLHRQFFEPATHSYAGGAQPYLALPLFVGLVPRDLRPAVMKNLEETILIKDKGHINAGMHGTYFLLKYLMDQDRNDVIYEMVSKRDYPSWGYMLDQGATTIWEDWSSRMSHIHDTLISVGSWFIQGLAGIRIDEQEPGFRHFFIKPGVVGDLTFVSAIYQSPYGKIVSRWRRERGMIHLNVTVPPGATATVYLPTSKPDEVTESERPAAMSIGVRPRGAEHGKAVFEIDSGDYAFDAPE
jgi:alpha-L-rhamnosidase